MNNIEEQNVRLEKLKLHIKYLIGISFSLICLVIILIFCEDSLFKSCISVSSTVTSIILSVIAIILSVTGERSTNEIRNKVEESVEKLEINTDKSSELTRELENTINSMNKLYENVNQRITEDIPQMKDMLDQLIHNSSKEENTCDEDKEDEEYKEENPAEHIIRFLNHINPKTKENAIQLYYYMETEGRKRPLSTDDIIGNLMKNGVDIQSAILAYGLVLGSFMTGTIDNISMNRLIQEYDNCYRK